VPIIQNTGFRISKIHLVYSQHSNTGQLQFSKGRLNAKPESENQITFQKPDIMSGSQIVAKLYIKENAF
jgi:hypothetical protein